MAGHELMGGFGIAMLAPGLGEHELLLRLEQRGWITSKWGVSDNNRRARYYSLTRTGRKQLAIEEADWDRTASIMERLLGRGEEPSQ